MKKRDFILIIFIILIAGSGFGLTSLLNNKNNQPLLAEISVNGNILYQINLTNIRAAETYEIPGPIGKSLVEVKVGAVRMHYSPCPDEYCMKTGWIRNPGQTIACVPNRIIIQIKAPTNYVDSISR